MADLTVTAMSVTSDPISGLVVKVALTDSRGTPQGGYDGDSAFVAPYVAVTDSSGQVVLDLVPNADITPAASRYTVSLDGHSFLIEKSADPQTLFEALV